MTQMPTKELTGPPQHDQIVSALVANTVADIRAGLECSTDDSTAANRDALLGNFLSIKQVDNIGVSLGSGKTTYREMYDILAPLADEENRLPWGVADTFRQFVVDLELLTIFEQEGVDGFNKRLDYTLKQLQKDGLSQEQQRDLTRGANRMLYRTIYLFPHLVNSIEVELDPRAADEEKTEALRNQYYEPRRYDYQGLHEDRAKRGDTDLDTLVIPLPYGFTTDTHGSGGRAAMSQSRRGIYFGYASKKGGKFNDQEQALMITIACPLITSHETMFLPSEVRSVKLSQREDFTPFWENHHRDGPLINRDHHIGYYLMFRNFSNYGDGRFIKDDQQHIILEPFKNTWNLWNGQYHRNGTLLKRGFFVDYADDPQVTTMYEVQNYKMKGSTTYEEAVAAMEDDVLTRDRLDKLEARTFSLITTNRPSFRKFSGDAIIDRLAQIPVLPRRF